MNIRSELSFSLLSAFAAVARSLHFGHAAEQLGIAQPALSQHIRRIEAIVGCRLLDRTTRNVQLTAAGSVLHELAERLIAASSAGIDRVRRVGNGEAGRLTIGFTATTALRALPAAAQLHRARYPDIELEFLELLPDALSTMLLSGQIDIGLVREFIPRPELGLIEVGRERYVAVMPTAVAAEYAERPLPLGMLRDQPFILFPTDHSSFNTERVMQICAENGFAPKTTLSVTSWQGAVSLVSVGLGVTLLPESTSCLALPQVAFVPIATDIDSRIDIIHRTGEDRPIVRTFIDSAMQTRST
jgi:DNA-binding transcriptional LysR family regulator